jgi:hypothetical protein
MLFPISDQAAIKTSSPKFVAVLKPNMNQECDYLDLATGSLHWLTCSGAVDQNFIRQPGDDSHSWTTPGSDLRVKLSSLGFGNFAFVWKASFVEMQPVNHVANLDLHTDCTCSIQYISLMRV